MTKSILVKKATAIAMAAVAAVSTAAFSFGSASAAETESTTVQYQKEKHNGVVYFEAHNVIQCVNRYKDNNGDYKFRIKYIAGEERNVRISLTDSWDGNVKYEKMSFKEMAFSTDISTSNYEKGSDGFAYLDITISKNMEGFESGVGMKLYFLNGICSYMATDQALNNTTDGNGYWLGK